MTRPALVPLGTPFRGDDAVGRLVAEAVVAAGADVDVLDCGDEPTRLIDALEGRDLVVVVDAVQSGAMHGTVHRIAAADGRLPRELSLASTHAMSVADALDLARALGRAPARVVLIGVEGRAFGMGDPITSEVEAAVRGAAAEVLRVLEAS